QPSLIVIDQLGSLKSEDDLCRPLLELYLHPNGARNHLCVSAGHHSSPWLFVSSDVENTEHGKLGVGCLSGIFGDTLSKYAGDLGLDLGRLKKAYGATGLHCIRTLFASFWVANGRTAFA